MNVSTWWWSLGAPRATCDDCGAPIENCLIAYESESGSMVCESCAESRGVAAEWARLAERARQEQLIHDWS